MSGKLGMVRDGQNTGFVPGPDFTTLAACPNVANLAVTSPNTTKAHGMLPMVLTHL